MGASGDDAEDVVREPHDREVGLEPTARREQRRVDHAADGNIDVAQRDPLQTRERARARDLEDAERRQIEDAGGLAHLHQQTQFELGNILFKVGVTCVMVTHDQEEAMTMADRIAVMTEGEIVQIGTPNEVYEFPSSRFCAEFIGTTNMFEGELAAENSNLMQCAELENPLQLLHNINGNAGKLLAISIRPEQISISYKRPQAKQNSTSGVVDQLAYMGSYSLFYVRLACGKLVVTSVSRLILQQMEKQPNYDETVYLSWNPASCVVLNW